MISFHQLSHVKSFGISLIRKGLGSVAVQAANRLLVLIVGVVLARMLGPEGYGTYVYAFAIMSFLMVAASAGVPTLLMREIAAAEARNEWVYLRWGIKRSFQLVTSVSVFLSIFGFIILSSMAESISSSMAYTMMMMLVLLPVSAILKVVGHALWGLRRVVTAQIVMTVLTSAFMIIIVSVLFFIYPQLRLPWVAMAVQIFAGIIAIAIGGCLLKKAVPTTNSYYSPAEFQKKVQLKHALPFLFISGSTILNTQTDIIMLGWFAKPEELGIYRIAVQGAILLPAMTLHIGNAITAPNFARLYTKNDMIQLQSLVTMVARAIFLFSVLIVLMMVFLGDFAIEWLFGKAFISAYEPLMILILGQLFAMSFGQVDTLLTMTGHEKIVHHLYWKTAIINVCLNLTLIPFLGMIGAAIATSLSLIFRTAMLGKYVKSKLDISSGPCICGARKIISSYL